MKICFVALAAYPHLAGEMTARYGGAETQQVHIARELIDKGFKVVFITFDYGQEFITNINGIEVIKAHVRSAGLPGTRFFYPRLISLWRTMKMANADVYCQMCTGSITGVVSFICKVINKPFVFLTASDTNMDLRYINRHFTIPFRDRKVYNYGLKTADRIVVQTMDQGKLLNKNFGLNGTLIPGALNIPQRIKTDYTNEHPIIFIGKIYPLKQPDIYIQLAKKIPDKQFIMIGGPGNDKKYFRYVEKLAEGVENLKYLGLVEDAQAYLQTASILVNTSKYEGFPTTFFEAWINNVPVVSLNVDPDECICKYKLGFHARTVDNLVYHVKLLIENAELRREMGDNGREYVEQNHNINKVVEKYADMFRSLLRNNSG